MKQHMLTDTLWGRCVLRTATLALLLIIWQWVGDDSMELLFPSATRTAHAFWDLLVDGRLPLGLLITGLSLLLGFSLIVGIGVPLGVSMARLPLLDRMLSPYFAFLVSIPMIALVPVVQMALGLTLAARVSVIFLFGISYVVINSAIAVRAVRRDLLDMAHSFGAGWPRTLFEVLLPGALPGIMTGLRLALGQALIGMVVAELTIVGAGVGSLIVELQGRFRTAGVLAVAVCVVGLGLILISLLEMAEKRLSRWSLSV